jgi:shikimate kinase
MTARRVVIVASASGNGKTALGRAVADRLGVHFVELDALVHGPNWTETPDDELRRRLAPIFALDGWVIDGDYEHKIGTFVLDAAELVVWLDLPVRVWFPRLVRRTVRRAVRREVLWNGNRETLRNAVWGRESLFAWAFRQHRRRRRDWPAKLSRYRVVRLRSVAEVQRWLDGVEPGDVTAPGGERSPAW